MLLLGCINYINALPLCAAILQGKVNIPGTQIVLGTPAELNTLLLQGKLDVSLISSVEFLRNQERLIHLLPFGIAAKESVDSVLLYHKTPLHLLKVVGVTSESATSVHLLKTLCQHYWKCSPRFEIISQSLDHFDAYLLIGDQALLNEQMPPFSVTDLATAWHSFTGLSMPFGVLAATKKTSLEYQKTIQSAFEASFNWSKEHFNDVVALALASLQSKNWDAKKVEAYLKKLIFLFEKTETDGLWKFASYV